MTIGSTAALFFALLGQVGQTEAESLFFIVCTDQTLAITMDAADAVARRVSAAASLHTATGLEAGNHVGRGGVVARARAGELLAVGVASREVEKVDTGENDEEAAEQRNGVDGIGSVESTEQDEGGAECGGRKGDIVKRVDTEARN